VLQQHETLVFCLTLTQFQTFPSWLFYKATGSILQKL